MREGSSNKPGTTQTLQHAKTEAKSFFCNILPVSHCASRFCRPSPYQRPAKALKADILAEPYQKNIAIYPRILCRPAKPRTFARLADASCRVFTACKLIQSP